MNSNKQKSEQLGVPFGTACGQLRKQILFSLLLKHGENICYRCKESINNVDDMTIEHKKAWFGVDAKLFWDLNNIAFSHPICNNRAGRRIEQPLCVRCKKNFKREDISRKQRECRECATKYMREWRRNKK